jgi:hypothetical protein
MACLTNVPCSAATPHSVTVAPVPEPSEDLKVACNKEGYPILELFQSTSFVSSRLAALTWIHWDVSNGAPVSNERAERQVRLRVFKIN